MKKIMLIFGIAFIFMLINMNISNAQLTNEKTQSGITVKLLNNTNYCDVDCHSIYNICIDSKVSTKITDLQFQFKTEKTELSSYQSILKSQPIITTAINKDCFDIRIDGKKGIFENVDNVPCFKDICFKDFAWWNTTCKDRTPINTISNIPNMIFWVNDTYGIYGNHMITQNKTELYYYNCSYGIIDKWVIGNSTNQLFWENETIDDGYNYYQMYNESGLLGFWTFGNGNYRNDSTQWDNPITLVGSTVQSPDALIGQSLNFDFSGYAFIPQAQSSNFLFTSSNSFSLEVLIKPEMFGTYRNLIRMHSTIGLNTLWLLRLDVDNTIFFMLYDVTGTPNSCNSNITITDSNWYLIDAVFNATDKTSKIYSNGVMVANCSSPNAFATTLTCLLFGTDVGCAGTSERYDGKMDYIRIYNKPLSIDEINMTAKNIFNQFSFFGEQENLISYDFQFNILDSFTNVHLTNINIICNEFNISGNSPLNYIFTNITVYDCNISSPYYYNQSFSFVTSNLIKTISMDRIGLTSQEHQWLKTTYILQNVQGMELLSTNNTCINNNSALKHIYETEICIDSSCNNVTLKQSIVPCPYGCGTQLNQYGDGCLQPTYIMDILIIVIVIIIIVIAVYLSKRK